MADRILKQYIPGNCSHPKKSWAEFNKEWVKMIKDHKREACPNCGVYCIWVKSENNNRQ